MRFLTRSLFGMALLVLTLGILALAAGNIMRALAERDAADRQRPPARERVYAVNIDTLVSQSAQPVLTAYGDLQSARQLELRAAAGGRLMELAPGFRDGGRVAAGETLYRIDPADARTAFDLATSDLAAARAEEVEARAARDLAVEEMTASERQRDLRAQSLARSEDLRGRGVATATAHEVAELAVATAEQAVTGRRLAVAQAEARIERARIAAGRAVIKRDEASRLLDDTSAAAPFDGVLAEVSAVPGRLVTVNEKLGLLLDPSALEVVFRVSNAEFARLADASGLARPLKISAGLEIDGIELSVPGRIDRAGASTGSGQSGRLIYARLDADGLGLLRPGDFLTVRVDEPPLSDVAVLPATAISAAGRILVLGAGDRLEEAGVTVLRRQGDVMIVSGVPFGREYVTERLPQLGPGILVRPFRPGGAALEDAGEAMVSLTPERRAGLVAVVEASRRMPAGAKARILAALEADKVPQRMIDRLESRRSGG